MGILSDREDDMVQGLLKGLACKEIAAENFISTHTVNTHFKSIKNKLHAKNNVEVAVKYLAALKEPGKYLKQLLIAILFLGIQGVAIASNHDTLIRRPRTRTMRTVRNVRTRLQ